MSSSDSDLSLPLPRGAERDVSENAPRPMTAESRTTLPTARPPRFCYSAAPTSLVLARIAGEYAATHARSTTSARSASPPRTAAAAAAAIRGAPAASSAPRHPRPHPPPPLGASASAFPTGVNHFPRRLSCDRFQDSDRRHPPAPQLPSIGGDAGQPGVGHSSILTQPLEAGGFADTRDAYPGTESADSDVPSSGVGAVAAEEPAPFLLQKPLTRKGTLTRLVPEPEELPESTAAADKPAMVEQAAPPLLMRPLTRKDTLNRMEGAVVDELPEPSSQRPNADQQTSSASSSRREIAMADAEGKESGSLAEVQRTDAAAAADAESASRGSLVSAPSRRGTFRNADVPEMAEPSPGAVVAGPAPRSGGPASVSAHPSARPMKPPHRMDSETSVSSLSGNTRSETLRSPAAAAASAAGVATTPSACESLTPDSGGPGKHIPSRRGLAGVVLEAQEAANRAKRPVSGSASVLPGAPLSEGVSGVASVASVADWMLGLAAPESSQPGSPELHAGEASSSLTDLEELSFPGLNLTISTWAPPPAPGSSSPASVQHPVNFLASSVLSRGAMLVEIANATVHLLPGGLAVDPPTVPAVRYGEIVDIRRLAVPLDEQSTAATLSVICCCPRLVQHPAPRAAAQSGKGPLSLSQSQPPYPSHQQQQQQQQQRSEILFEGDPALIVSLHAALSTCLFKTTQAVTRSLRTTRRTLVIVHFNDVYNLDPPANVQGDIIGGASRFHSLLSAIRQGSNPLVLFSGDFMGPSLMSVETKGKQMIDAFNLLGVHYGCFGNHEFDYGKRALLDAVHGYTQGPFVFSGSTTTWIMSNMTEKDSTPLCGAKEWVLTMWNGIRIGLLGLCENWLGGCSQLSPDDAVYHDVFERGEALAQKLKGEGAELVIALSHCRIENDKRIAARCPSIDLVLGGHDHFYKNLIHRRVVKSGEEFQYLSEIRIDMTAPSAASADQPGMAAMAAESGRSDVGSGVPLVDLLGPSDSISTGEAEEIAAPMRFQTQVRTHVVTKGIPTSPMMDRVIKRYNAKLHERMGGVIGRTAVELDPTERACRFHEGLLTGFVADVMAAQLKADFAVIGGAAISGKAPLPPGPITVGDVFGWFPNDTRVMCLRMSGSTVRKMLNVMVREMPQEAPSFPHCSANLQFTIDLFRKPPEVVDVKYRRQPLRDDEMYTVAVEDFAGKGSGKYKFVPEEGEVLVDDESAEQLVFWVIDFFTSKKGQTRDGNVLAKNAHTTVAPPSPSPPRTRGSEKRGSSRHGGASSRTMTDEHAALETSHVLQRRTVASAGAARPNVYPAHKFRSLEFSASLDSAMLARVFAAMSLLLDDIESGSNMTLITKVISKLLKCEMVRVYLYDDVSQQLRLASVPYSEQSATRLSLDSGTVAALTVLDRACVNIAHPRDPLFHANVDDIAPGVEMAPHVMSMLSFPVLFKKKVLGVVQAINKLQPYDLEVRDRSHSRNSWGSSESDSESSASELETFTMTDIGVAQLIGRQIGLQLHFTAIFGRMKRSERARDHLMEMALRLGRAEKDHTVKGMVLKIVNLASSLLHCDRASLFLVDKGDLWTVVPSKDFTSEITIRLPRGTGVVGHVVETGQMMNVHDAYLCKQFNPEVDRRTGYRTRTILALPIFASNQDDIIGVLQLINKNDGTVFDRQDEELAANFCQLAAVAVHNSFEMETLRVGRDDSSLQILPVHELSRIRIRGGWLTCRSCVKKIISPEFKRRIALTPIAPSDAEAARLHAATSQYQGDEEGSGCSRGPSGRSAPTTKRAGSRPSTAPGPASAAVGRSTISSAVHEFEEFGSLLGHPVFEDDGGNNKDVDGFFNS